MLTPQLAGVWTTDDPQYQERFVELSPTFVIIVTGPRDPISIEWIDKVQSESQAENIAFTIFSSDYPQERAASDDPSFQPRERR